MLSLRAMSVEKNLIRFFMFSEILINKEFEVAKSSFCMFFINISKTTLHDCKRKSRHTPYKTTITDCKQAQHT